jgi:hypothetical protein
MEDDNLPLRRRVPGEARSAPAPSRRPVLSEAQLRRMQSAIDAARAEAAVQDKESTGPPPHMSGTSPAGARSATTGRPATAGIDRQAAAQSSTQSEATAEGSAKRSYSAVSFIRRSRRSAAPVSGGVHPPPAAGTRPGLAPPEPAERTVPAYGAGALAPTEPDTLPKRSPSQPADGTQHTAPAPTRTLSQPDTLPKRAPGGTSHTAPSPPREPAGPDTLPKRTPGGTSHTAPSPPREPAGPDTLPMRTPGGTPHTAPPPPPAEVPSLAPAVTPHLPGQPARTPDPANRAEPAAAADPAVAVTGGSRTAVPSRQASQGRQKDQSERTSSAPATAPLGTSTLTPSAARLRAPYRRRRISTVYVTAAAAVVFTLGAVAVSLLHSPPRAAGARRTPTVLQRQEAANRTAAAAWVSQQISPSTVVACDAATCQALRDDGFPAANLRLLQKSSPYPLSSQVVIETAAVRGIFGSSLGAQVAPEVITTVGAGSAIVVIRLIAQHGVAAYERELASDLSVRKRTGMALLGGGARITTLPAARQQLADGEVDTRLLYAITALAAVEPIDIVDFGSIATDPSGALPLRYADLAEHERAAHESLTAYVNSLVKVLNGIGAPFGPIRSQTVKLSPGMDVLRIEVSAPSPLGLLGTGRQ